MYRRCGSRLGSLAADTSIWRSSSETATGGNTTLISLSPETVLLFWRFRFRTAPQSERMCDWVQEEFVMTTSTEAPTCEYAEAKRCQYLRLTVPRRPFPAPALSPWLSSVQSSDSSMSV